MSIKIVNQFFFFGFVSFISEIFIFNVNQLYFLVNDKDRKFRILFA